MAMALADNFSFTMRNHKFNMNICLLLAGLMTFSSFVMALNNDMTFNSFGNYQEGVVAAFGDLNSDELTDAFIIVNKSNIVVYLAHDKEPLLRPSQYSCKFENLIITSIVPGDYDGDAYMDVMLTTQPINSLDKLLHDVRIIWGGKESFNCTDALNVKLTVQGHPLVLDYNRDMILDLFGINMFNERTFWLFDNSRDNPTEQIIPGIFKPIKLPHSHSFIDVNNDDAADILITTTSGVEVWLNDDKANFVHERNIDLLLGYAAIYGQVLLSDISLTGQFFLVVPVCSDLDCTNSSIIMYNNDQWIDLNVNFVDENGTLWTFVPPKEENYLDTITMRSGDYNMDGYPDILMTLQPLGGNKTQVFLLHNTPCNRPDCSFRRTFTVQWSLFSSFGSNIVMATFYDFYMDGILDVIYVQKNETSNKYTMHAFKNELEFDTNFIKVIVVTGLTNAVVPTINTTLYSSKVTFGTNLPGPRISYNTWSQEGTYRTGVCAQLPQSAYYALQLPYSIFGLDRTPNFVDSLNVGLCGFTKSWTQLIPNSQIVVIPKPPDQPSQWLAKLFVTPSKLILRSITVLTAILVIIFSIIIYLHKKEKNDPDEIIEIEETDC